MDGRDGDSKLAQRHRRIGMFEHVPQSFVPCVVRTLILHIDLLDTESGEKGREPGVPIQVLIPRTEGVHEVQAVDGGEEAE